MSGADRFRTLRAHVRLDLAYVGRGPILVKGPDATLPERPDMAFIRYPTDVGEAPFLPGSSIKGVLRSGVEAALRALGEQACDPFDRQGSCSARRAEERCEACLLFGSMLGAGVACFSDALPWRDGASTEDRRRALAELEERTTIRNGVGIDRRTGSAVRGALFDYEVLVDPTFHGSVALRNPTRRQVELLALGVRLLDEGMLRVGAGSSRGLGRLRAIPRTVEVLAVAREGVEGLLDGVALPGPREEGLLLRWSSESVDGSAQERMRCAREALAAWASSAGPRPR
ncbi:RAMP superfamily CRISPR-associated protein [Rhabdothermincola sediminis]|uniref:RAMP superfamily CRISPR-associated protein n=1 Tax=Rhabdothermincola sediminis TaxID=2751370 RepID=UPI001AA0828F|nr:RAMP superfamily CRISPR-associated protein [Rhabdothermincola sediminis]